MPTILLVDNPDGDASVLASALRVEGFEVVVTAEPAETHATLGRAPVALVVVDLMLRSGGGPNGLELARELRRDHPNTRVILTSAYHLSERQLERADCGVSGFIPKPYDVADVVAFIMQKVAGPPSSRRFPMLEPVSHVRTDAGPIATARRR